MNRNLERYRSPAVVDFYTRRHTLEAAEKKLYGTYIQKGSRVLDVGVGGGRTTPYLSARAGFYVGIDYADKMLLACRKRFPLLGFVLADAADLSMFRDSSFDSIVFSFNGIGFLESDAARKAFLQHSRRILSVGGYLIFSCHNAGFLFSKPARAASAPRRLWRGVRAAINNRRHLLNTFTSGVFVKGEGYILEQAHGGLRTHYADPTNVVRELEGAGFSVLEVLSQGFPERCSRHNTPWYHYACRADRP